jgi:hypothetical protein
VGSAIDLPRTSRKQLDILHASQRSYRRTDQNGTDSFPITFGVEGCYEGHRLAVWVKLQVEGTLGKEHDTVGVVHVADFACACFADEF